MKLVRPFWLFIYYAIAKNMPLSYRMGFVGKIAMILRRKACSYIFKSAGRDINVERGAWFGAGSNIEIGDYSGLGENCQIPDNIRIGCDVMMAPDVLIISRNHGFEDLDIPMRLQGARDVSPVTIGNDVWIGARAIILPGIRIGDGAIIGAGSVVTRDVPSRAVCAGNPARVIRYRGAP